MQVICPILRGRDIKRYGYEFADLWIIATFPSLHYDIDVYPAVKQHLLSFGYDRLKQTGDVGARKKTNNEWFETQDSISYWDDFFKPKIIFQEIVQEPSFMMDFDEHFFCLDTGRIITGKNLEFLLSIFNSNIFFFAIKHFYGGGGLGATGVRMKHTFFEHFPCINTQNLIETLSEKTNQIIQNKAIGINTHTLEEEAETLINNAYGLTQEEIQFIENQ